MYTQSVFLVFLAAGFISEIDDLIGKKDRGEGVYLDTWPLIYAILGVWLLFQDAEYIFSYLAPSIFFISFIRYLIDRYWAKMRLAAIIDSCVCLALLTFSFCFYIVKTF